MFVVASERLFNVFNISSYWNATRFLQLFPATGLQKKLSRNFQAFPNIFPEVFPERKGENVKYNAIALLSRLLIPFWQLVIIICVIIKKINCIIVPRCTKCEWEWSLEIENKNHWVFEQLVWQRASGKRNLHLPRSGMELDGSSWTLLSCFSLNLGGGGGGGGLMVPDVVDDTIDILIEGDCISPSLTTTANVNK